MKKIRTYYGIVIAVLALSSSVKADGYISIGYLSIHGDTLLCPGDSIHTVFILPTDWGCYGEKHGSDYQWFRNGDSLGSGLETLWWRDSIIVSDTGIYYCTFKIYNDLYFTTTNYITTPVSISINQNCATGINEIRTSEVISIYPNPATTLLNIHHSTCTSPETLLITDLLGTVVYKEELHGISTTISISTWSAGIYFYEVRSQQGSTRGKFIKE